MNLILLLSIIQSVIVFETELLSEQRSQMLHEFLDDPSKIAKDNRKLLQVARFIQKSYEESQKAQIESASQVQTTSKTDNANTMKTDASVEYQSGNANTFINTVKTENGNPNHNQIKFNLTVMKTNLIVNSSVHVNNEVSIQKCDMGGNMNILESIGSYHLNTNHIRGNIIRVFHLQSDKGQIVFHAQLVVAKLKTKQVFVKPSSFIVNNVQQYLISSSILSQSIPNMINRNYQLQPGIYRMTGWFRIQNQIDQQVFNRTQTHNQTNRLVVCLNHKQEYSTIIKQLDQQIQINTII